jgi:hypothetical protein
MTVVGLGVISAIYALIASCAFVSAVVSERFWFGALALGCLLLSGLTVRQAWYRLPRWRMWAFATTGLIASGLLEWAYAGDHWQLNLIGAAALVWLVIDTSLRGRPAS